MSRPFTTSAPSGCALSLAHGKVTEVDFEPFLRVAATDVLMVA
jgi:hypothetical protein